MATYTDNNNAISVVPIQGAAGPIGFTGYAGTQGYGGQTGTEGAKGTDNYISTDIMFSGEAAPYKTITAPPPKGPKLVGGFIFNRQKEITSIKILVGAITDSPTLNAKIWLGVMAATPDSSGNAFLAQSDSVISGSGREEDYAIINLTLENTNFNNKIDATFLWASISNTTDAVSNTLKSQSRDGYTPDEIIRYKEQIFELSLDNDIDSIYNILQTDYGTTLNNISAKKQASLDAIKTTLELNRRHQGIPIPHPIPPPAPPPIVPAPVPPAVLVTKLKVYYLKII